MVDVCMCRFISVLGSIKVSKQCSFHFPFSSVLVHAPFSFLPSSALLEDIPSCTKCNAVQIRCWQYSIFGAIVVEQNGIRSVNDARGGGGRRMLT